MIKKLDKSNMVVVGVLIFAVTMFLTGHFIFGSFIVFFLMLVLLRNEKKNKMNKTKEELEEKLQKEKKYFPFILGAILLVFTIFTFSNSGDSSSSNKNTTSSNQEVVSAEEKQKAWKNFVDSLNLMKEGGIISSYDFSETSNVIYVSNGWYTMPVQQKKDFLTSLSSMKKVATGYHRLEVRDVYSNELVAEVTAFGGGVNILK